MRTSLAARRSVFTYSGTPITGIANGAAPSLLNTSCTITADITVPEGGAEGMIVGERRGRRDRDTGANDSNPAAGRRDIRHRIGHQDPVEDWDYQVPFTFTGKIDQLTITVAPPMLMEEDKQRLEEGLRKGTDHG